jgi:S1-C subfamily serine protease
MATVKVFSRFLLASTVMVAASCASHQAKPPVAVTAVPPHHHGLVGLKENRLATFRVDILPQGHGSGTVISTDGHILTAAHVARSQSDSAGIQIVLVGADGKPKAYPAKVVAVDEKRDLAIIKIDRKFSRSAAVEHPDNVEAGDEIYAVGYPQKYGETVNRGYIAKRHWSYAGEDGRLIVDDRDMAKLPGGPGTSGCGVFSATTGRLLGVTHGGFQFGGPVNMTPMYTVIVKIEHIREFLAKHRIPHESGQPARGVNRQSTKLRKSPVIFRHDPRWQPRFVRY